ncbi:MAG: OmpH family outer membrane protein [Verrucomicrobiota bacterium]|jgi:Skp family chaperone for outer membrane proteins
MKKVIQSLVMAAGLVCWPHSAPAADPKIATVDLGKVFDKYYKTIQSSASLKLEASDMEKERAQMVDAEKKHEDEWRGLIDKANDQAVSAEAREQSKKAAGEKYSELESDKQSINEFDRVANTRLREKLRQRHDDIVKEILGVLTADAKAAGYTMVLDVSGASANTTPVVLYSNGQNDMTEALIKELNSAAPPGSLETNSATATAVTNLPAKAK